MRVLAVLTVRNEGPFLIDWLAHHRAAGVTDVLVFSNDCDDGTDAMLDRMAALGWLTHVPNPGPHPQGPQWAALKAADRHPLTRAADWAIVMDIDEYLTIHAGNHTIPALLAALPADTDAIALTWRMFGNAGEVGIEDRPVTERFTRAAPPALHWPWRAVQFKTLFRRAGPWLKLGVHRPRSPDPAAPPPRWVDGSGRPAPDLARSNRSFSALGQDCGALVQLNHYALGSAQDYLVKADRGRANRDASAFDLGYWVDRNFCAVEDRSALSLDCAAARAALRADPELGRLHSAALDWRRARLAALMQDEPWRALYGRLLMAPPTRLLSAAEAEGIWRHGQRLP